jgi:hypothetical protein
MPPSTTGPLAIETTAGEELARIRVECLPHDMAIIEPLDEGPTGGDL